MRLKEGKNGDIKKRPGGAWPYKELPFLGNMET